MEFVALSLEEFLDSHGDIAIILIEDELRAQLDQKLGGQISKILAQKSDSKEKATWHKIVAPIGIEADNLYFAAQTDDMQKLGGELANRVQKDVTVYGGDERFVFGFALRNYRFEKYKKEPKTLPKASFVVEDVSSFAQMVEPWISRAEGVHLARDLVNEPANVLTTTEFADRISGLSELGLQIEILDEAALEDIGMRALLGVGQGSPSPSKVAIMQWSNGNSAPLALVGKGVVFDTGGISLKPAAGMEDMIMDMGGAASVVGAMHSIAARKAKANVIGIVGLVENMPDGQAQRPGDIVKTLKGDTVEVINTDAEGRLVLADVLWYVQERFEPAAIIDLATLTGAIIVALGVEKAGIFGNDDDFTQQLMDAAKGAGEGAWPMPLDKAYDQLIKSKNADIANSGGRNAGSITAAQFLQNFVKSDTKWCHIDIAGVATRKSANAFSNKGATGWGVLTLDRLVSEHFEN